MRGKIVEIFDSIQGEGVYLGEKQIFVRFFGCNLQCNFCDTKINDFNEYEVSEVFKRIKSYPGEFHSISFTGGEPLLQRCFLKELLKLTKEYSYTNYLETNGTLPNELKEVIDYLDIIAMDLKLPSSTDDFPCWRAHRHFLEIASEKELFIKMVICNSTKKEDLLRVLGLLKELGLPMIIILQPNSNENGFMLNNKLEYYRMLCEQDFFPTCVIPQVHKIINWR